MTRTSSFWQVTAMAAGLTLTAACATRTTAPQPADWKVDTSGVEDMLETAVAAQRVAGAVAMIWQNGEEIFFDTEGLADTASGRQMSRDTLFQVYSMSKPITGMALMTLYEDGKFSLDDPLSKYLPEFADMMVFEGMDEAGNPVLVPAETPITIRQLVSHSAGFGYNADGDDYVSQQFAKDEPLDPSNTLAEMSERLSELPLRYQPGSQWFYSISVDVQARLVEVLSGQSFHAYLQEVIFTPLGMTDVHRFLTDDEKARLARGYLETAPGALTRLPEGNEFYSYNAQPHALEMGGSGLVMPIDNYARFARMLLNGGELDGVRILKPETIELMATDMLDWPLDGTHFLRDKGQFGFGVDFAVRTAPPASPNEQAGAVGEFFWDGYASTLFWVDPVNDLTAILLVQKIPFDGELHRQFRNAVYAGSPHAPPEE